jgi:transposase
MRSWLPPGHLAWQVLGAVGELDMSGFTAAYRADGQGQAPYDPAMMLTLMLYCYFKGIRSSRKIAAACIDDVGCRVICGGAAPSHQAAAQFVRRHRAEVVRLFVQVLGLLAAAGAVEGHCAAVDGSPVSGNASRFGNLDREQLEARITALEAAIDAAAQAWLAGAAEADAARSQQLPYDDDDARVTMAPAAVPAAGARLLAVMAATLARCARRRTWEARRPGGAGAPARSPDARSRRRDAPAATPGGGWPPAEQAQAALMEKYQAAVAAGGLGGQEARPGRRERADRPDPQEPGHRQQPAGRRRGRRRRGRAGEGVRRRPGLPAAARQERRRLPARLEPGTGRRPQP